MNIHSFLVDYSVDGPPISLPEFTFDKKFLGAVDNDVYITLASWKERRLPNYLGDLLLQMDIEGSEYEVLFNTSEDLLNTFRILVIEFHYLDRLFDPFMFKIYKSCFEKLLNLFYVVHLHPNNIGGSVKRGGLEIPRIMEFTLYSKRVSSTKPAIDFPHPLDVENVESTRTLPLPKCWYA